MAVLLSMDGKYYEIPDDQVADFEVPREKVRDVLAHSPSSPSERGNPGSGPGPRGAQAGPGGSPVIIQVLPNGLHGPRPAGGAAGAPGGEVDPYWTTWWTNWTNWANYW